MDPRKVVVSLILRTQCWASPSGRSGPGRVLKVYGSQENVLVYVRVYGNYSICILIFGGFLVRRADQMSDSFFQMVPTLFTDLLSVVKIKLSLEKVIPDLPPEIQ